MLFASEALVDLTDFCNLNSRDFLLLDLLLDLCTHDLRAGQRLNKLFIIQDVA